MYSISIVIPVVYMIDHCEGYRLSNTPMLLPGVKDQAQG